MKRRMFPWSVAIVCAVLLNIPAGAGAMPAVVVPLGKAPVIYEAAVARSGQRECSYSYANPYETWVADPDCQAWTRPPGQDGELRPGVAWPQPRFTDLGDGTVRDNLTGLVWLRDADCLGRLAWGAALETVAQLRDGWRGDPAGGDCGLSDGSRAGAWRLPTVREMQSIIDYGRAYPALCNTTGLYKWSEGDPFTGVRINLYWTSTSDARDADLAWFTDVNTGRQDRLSKQNGFYLWPVKEGADR